MIDAMEGHEMYKNIGLTLGKIGIYLIVPPAGTMIIVLTEATSTGYDLTDRMKNHAIIVGKCEELLKKDHDISNYIVSYLKELLTSSKGYPNVQFKETILNDEISFTLPPLITDEEVSMELMNLGSENSKVASFYNLLLSPDLNIICPQEQTAYCIRSIDVTRLSESIQLARNEEKLFRIMHDQVLLDWFDSIKEVIKEWKIEELPIRITGEINIIYGVEDGFIAAKTKQIDRTMYMRYDDGVPEIFKQYTGIVEMSSNLYEVSFLTNSQVTNFKPLTPDLKTFIEVSGSSGKMGEMNITIKKSFVEEIGMKENIQVTVDAKPKEFIVEEKTDTFDISFKYTHSTHSIIIDYNSKKMPNLGDTQYLYIFPMILIGVTLLLYYLKR
jgi:hypothetical protein